MLQVSVWTYRTVDMLSFHFNILLTFIDTFLPLLLFVALVVLPLLIQLVLFAFASFFYLSTKCTIACHSEWHYWRRHVPQREWKEAVGQGVGWKSKGKVSCHAFYICAERHAGACPLYLFILACVTPCVCLSPQDGWSNCAYRLHKLEGVPRTGELLKTCLKDCPAALN